MVPIVSETRATMRIFWKLASMSTSISYVVKIRGSIRFSDVFQGVRNIHCIALHYSDAQLFLSYIHEVCRSTDFEVQKSYDMFGRFNKKSLLTGRYCWMSYMKLGIFKFCFH